MGVCDTQPVLAEGLRAILAASGSYHLLNPVRSLEEAARVVVAECPRILLLDKALGSSAVIDWLARHKSSAPVSCVIWCASVTEAESLRLLKGGAAGILRKTAEAASVLACLDAVANGRTWMDEDSVRQPGRSSGRAHSDLTPREQQVLELVEQGLRNKEIARELGIRPGTVKIHLKHIFEKTGIHGRYGLAISGLRDRGAIPMMVA